MGEFRIRDLNDDINKLLREKGHWEVRIRELGGPDYSRVGPKMLDQEGKEVPGNRGYKYITFCLAHLHIFNMVNMNYCYGSLYVQMKSEQFLLGQIFTTLILSKNFEIVLWMA